MQISASLVILIALAADVRAASAWKIQREVTLAVPSGVAQDVRWASDTQLFVAEGSNGVTVRRVETPEKVESFAIAPSKQGGFFFASRLAASPSFVAVASPVVALSWRARSVNAPLHQSVPAAMTIDIDIYGDTLAILGGETDQQGGTPDGILSIGTLSKSLADRRIVMEGPTGKAGKELVRCHFFEPGAIRFLPDGSLVVAPGLMPGVFQYSAAGKLLRTWQTDSLDVLNECRVSDEQMIEMAADFAKRTEWVNRTTIIDDILPFADGPALLLRTVRNNTTSWDVAYLRANGSITREPLPIRSPSPRAHLRGDVRGDRIALLVFDYELPGNAPLSPRLILATR
ncbi:MAG: hypothetical protein ACTHQM_05650 [Thermoanaerobaculia bacterium]